jgi:Papain family cysteine protease
MMQNVEEYDRGYDPTVWEPFPTERPRFLDRLPGAAIVNPAYLPPVGQQGTSASIGSPGTCCAWATVYGLATFTAASAGRVDPSVASGQASPAQIYIDVLKKHNTHECSCAGTSFADYFSILLAGGTQSLAEAPYISDCTALWLAYKDGKAKPRREFKFDQIVAVETRDLDSVKQPLARGQALCYGTRLFTDWKDYNGDKPYSGNWEILVSKKGDKPAGHCMLIIGYDDSIGAVLIQNSEGRLWGSAGYVWMAYSSFQFLAQGQAFYANVLEP